ncbi:MAG TPA: serine hydrolase domain-containing protein [Solirubrobacteraceae bacterium]|nr:serine hydrolase domain-containing protein [Solirubrobacteraceae bacterium]
MSAPGRVVAVAAPDGSVRETATGGLAEDAVVELGSVTKAVTGLLLADAVVRGEVALDTPLAACLPGARAGIALEPLATHTAGLPRVPLALLRRVGFTNTTDPYARTTTAELVRDLARVRIRRAGRPRYSNFGAALLGQALAARAGVPYERLVHERILGPLGVTQVWAQGGPEPAQPHGRRGKPVPPWTLGAYAPAGGLRGTARGALALATGCLRPPPELAAAVGLALARRARRHGLVFGLGWIEAHGMWWHNGGTNGSRAFVALRPASGRAVAAVANSRKAPDRAAVAQLDA